MRICFIGKYPPIEGGVSVQSYWTLRGLAERGHEVHVVTNADEVEDHYRLSLEDDDAEWLQPRFPSAGGFVEVRNCESFGVRRMNHIPLSNPFVTKLASLATQTVRQYDCEAIYSYYFEPYGMAGHLASHWTGVPQVVRHAGSDLERLMKVPDLSTAYKEVVRAAALVLTGKGLVERFVRMGVGVGRIRSGLGFSPPPTLFNPQAAPMDVNGFLRRLAAQGDAEAHTGPLDLSKPTIGIYGKVGELKGSFDLVRALGLLKREGLDFNFLAMTHGTQGEHFRKMLRENDLEDRTRLLPFVPNWRVPSFIRACTAVCFLERDSPIALHGPMIAREVIACGTCLIVSGEVASKQGYHDLISDGQNMLVVANPKSPEDLAARLRFVIERPEAAREIGARGSEVSEAFEDYPGCIRDYENMFLELAGRRSACVPAQDVRVQSPVEKSCASASDKAEEDVREVIAAHFQCTLQLIGEQLESVHAQYERDSDPIKVCTRKEVARFGDFLSRLVKRQQVTPAARYFGDVLRFEKIASAFFADSDETDRVPPFTSADELGERKIGAETTLDLRPLRSNHARVVSFSYDIEALLAYLRRRALPPEPFPEQETLVLFHKAPNLVKLTLKINEPTNDLLMLCDGVRTLRTVLSKLASLHGADCAESEASLTSKALSALRSLYGKGVIIFCR